MSPRKKAPALSAKDVAAKSVSPIARAVVPTVASSDKFRPMLQGTGTNRLTQVSSRSSKAEIDEVTGLATITSGSTKVFIERYEHLTGGLRVSTHKLLDACTMYLTEQVPYRSDAPVNTLVSIPLDTYMERCGVPMTKASKDKMRRKVKEDLETLYNTSIEWSEPAGNKVVKDYAKIRVISLQSIRNGNIEVRFSPEMAAYLTGSYITQYPMALLRLDERNPNAYYLGKKLSLHYSMENNRKKGTNRLLSVKALLESTPDIPTYEEVMAGDRHLDRKIITPFESALNALSDILTWEYASAKGVPLTDEALEKFDYDTFIKSYVHFEMI